MLLETLKKDRLEARKLRQAVTSDLLGTVIGEAQQKCDGRDPDDATIVAVLKKFKSGCDEIIAANPHGILANKSIMEVTILDRYIPKQLTEKELAEIANEFKVLGEFQKHLRAEYTGLYDGKLASQVFNSKVA
jgi:uncharacterized protein YqeY